MKRDLEGSLLAGLAVVAAAVVAALLMRVLYNGFAGNAESFVLATLAGFLVIIAIILPAVIWQARKREQPGLPALALASVATAGLLAVYFFQASYYVMFPADILIWSESDFVHDILKLQLGYPLYTEQANNESFNYNPGAQLLTFAIAAATGQMGSIPAYRAIQLGYTVLTAIVAVQCWRILVRHSGSPGGQGAGLWMWLVMPFLLLCATNLITNPFAQFIHNDALAQLICVTGFWLLLKHSLDEWRGAIWFMALVPAVGFFVKQSLAIWAPLYVVHMLLFDRRRSWPRLIIFALVSFGLAAAVFGLGLLLWGSHFKYWTYDVLAEHGVNPLRSVQHMLDAWAYFAIGLVAGLALIRGQHRLRFFGAWAVGMSLLAVEAYTSGVAWMLNHMGPGSLLAGILFMAALPHFAEALEEDAPGWIRKGLRPALATGVFLLLLPGLGLVRIPLPPLSEDADRYVRDIEAEFAGMDVRRVLIDVGTWPYLEQQVLMRDRAPSIGERGYTQTGDFSGILGRLSRQEYDKILVRNFGRDDFWYDHQEWPVPSGIAAALETHYRVDHRIAPVELEGPHSHRTYSLGEISVLVPRDSL